MNVLRQTVRSVAAPAKRAQQRMMSGGSQAEEWAAANQWTQISKGMAAFTGVLLVINGAIQAGVLGGSCSTATSRGGGTGA